MWSRIPADVLLREAERGARRSDGRDRVKPVSLQGFGEARLDSGHPRGDRLATLDTPPRTALLQQDTRDYVMEKQGE